jgi:hypothetical protein
VGLNCIAGEVGIIPVELILVGLILVWLTSATGLHHPLFFSSYLPCRGSTQQQSGIAALANAPF